MTDSFSTAAARDLARIVGQDALLTDAAMRPYLSDATEAEGIIGNADVVVLPSRPDHAAAVVGWCANRGIPVVARGGGTGYAGGCVPAGGVVLCMERLRRVRSVEPGAWCGEFDAGVTTRRIQDLARDNGLYYPVDPGAGEVSHIGGNVATNAGGPHTFKYGVTRNWVTGLEVVLVSGEMIRLGGFYRKDVSGYDLLSLFAGSEGTLGLITGVTLRFLPTPAARLPIAAFFSSCGDASAAIEATMASGVVPSALDYLDAATLEIVGATFPGEIPEGTGFALLVEADGSEDEAAAGRNLISDALMGSAISIVTPNSREEIATLWRWREGVGSTVDGVLGGKMSEDVTVPLSQLADVIEETIEIGRRNNIRACSWGHAGDGNLHATFLFDRADPVAAAAAKAAVRDLFQTAIDHHGTISGEHGVGQVKNGWLGKQWEPGAVALHQAVKRLFDPAGVLNPGKKLA